MNRVTDSRNEKDAKLGFENRLLQLVKNKNLNVLSAAQILATQHGVKPVSIIVVKGQQDLVGGNTRDVLRDILDKAGLYYVIEEIVVDGSTEIEYCIGADKNLVDELRALFKQEDENWVNNTEIQDRIGELLGYPKTAREYFNKRQHHFAKTGQLTKNLPGYCFYIHSPENAQSEYEEFDLKIFLLVKKKYPRIWSELASYLRSNNKFEALSVSSKLVKGEK